ncbi:MAG: aldo/keto reductase [Simkaniaceae bacterium]|nr:aldo/keto reductase [Simkaniaceae bacterium]
MYHNQSAIGKALKGYPRSELFLTSKISMRGRDTFHVDDLSTEIEQILNELQTHYLDLLLLHEPHRELPMRDILLKLIEAKERGWVRVIGVSNCTIHHLNDALQWGIDAIEVNQVEFHPYLNQKELHRFCKANGIHLTAYRPLGKGEMVHESIFKKIGEKYNKSGAQVILRWLIQKNISAIPKAVSEAHLRENWNVFDFTLQPADMVLLEGLNRNQRYCTSEYFDFDY